MSGFGLKHCDLGLAKFLGLSFVLGLTLSGFGLGLGLGLMLS